MIPMLKLHVSSVVLLLVLPMTAYQPPALKGASTAANEALPVAALWNDRADISTLDVLHGPGGLQHQPGGKFTFVEEDKQGTSPKFVVLDEQGTRWKVKLGDETKSETAATRLVWAAGYYTDEDYYLPELRVENLPKLERGGQFVSADGIVHGARLERKLKGEK